MRSLISLLDTRKMSKIMLLFGVFDIILCEIQTKSDITISKISQVPPCRNPFLCHLLNETKSKSLSFLSYPNFENYGRQRSNLQHSYSGFATSTSPAYYPTFDPISILASLAFLAFLLQLFASFFDHSRSILPTIVSGRQTIMNLTIPEISRHVSHALQEYESLNEDLQSK